MQNSLISIIHSFYLIAISKLFMTWKCNNKQKNKDKERMKGGKNTANKLFRVLTYGTGIYVNTAPLKSVECAMLRCVNLSN